MTEVAQVWEDYTFLGGACTVLYQVQGLLVHPGMCEGYKDMVCHGGACPGSFGVGCPGESQGMQHAGCQGWGCSRKSQGE